MKHKTFCFSPGNNCTVIVLLLERFASLQPGIIVSAVIKVAAFLYSSFVSLSFYFDGKKRVRFSGILSEVLFHWWLLVIINDHSKTNFYLSSSLKKWYFTLKCLDIQSKLFNKVISVVPRTLNSIILILVLLISVTI